MSFWGNLLKIIAIGAFFIATGPFGLVVKSAIATILRIGGVVLSYLGALIDRPMLLQDRQHSMVQMALDPGTPIPVVYGRAKVGAIIDDWFINPSNNTKQLYVIAVFCHGSRDSLGVGAVDEVWLDQAKAINVTADTYYYPPYTRTAANYKVFLGTTVQNVGGTKFYTSGSPAGVLEPGNVTNSGWSLTTDTGKGLCCIGFLFVNVSAVGVGGELAPVFRGPPSIAAVIRGNRIYDSRTDTWIGGGDNPAMVIRDYLLAPIYGCGYDPTLIHEQSFKDAADYCDTLVRYVVSPAVTITSSSVANPSIITTAAPHGFATSGTFLVRIAGHSGSTPSINNEYTATYVSASSFSIPVNVTVGGTGGTVVKLVEIKRATCNGVLDTSRATSDNLQELLSSCRGNLVWEQGQFKLTIRSPSVPSPTVTLDPSIIIGQWTFSNAGLEEKWNSVTASYVEPANGEFKVQEIQWPLVGTTNNYLSADGGFTNNLQLSLPFTNDQLMAQGMAQITLNESRLGITASCTCTEAALRCSVGDRVYVTHPTPGWTNKQFWVTSLQLLSDTTVAVSLQEYDSTAYDLATQEDRRSFPATSLDSIFTVPSPGAVTITGLTPQGILIAWSSANYGHIDFYEIQAKCTSAGDPYITVARVREASGLLQANAPLARPGQIWDARVRVVNVVGWPSAWVDASQFTFPVPGSVSPGVGQLTWTGFAPSITIIAAPTLNSVGLTEEGGDLCLDTGNWVNSPSWNVTNPNDTYFQIDIDVANDSAGTSYSSLITGLSTVTGFYDNDTGVQVKTVTAGSGFPDLTFYRKYKVKLVRKSDSAVITSLQTPQGTLVRYSGDCGP